MGINDRPARLRPTTRNAFVSINMPLVETTETAEGVTASIPMEQLSLTSSARYLGTISQGDEGDIVVNVADSAVTAVRFVRVDYINNDVTKPVLADVVIANVNVNDSTAHYSTAGLPDGKYTFLAFGLIPTESASSATLDNLHTPTTADFTSAVVLSNLVASGELVETATIGVNATLVDA